MLSLLIISLCILCGVLIWRTENLNDRLKALGSRVDAHDRRIVRVEPLDEPEDAPTGYRKYYRPKERAVNEIETARQRIHVLEQSNRSLREMLK